MAVTNPLRFCGITTKTYYVLRTVKLVRTNDMTKRNILTSYRTVQYCYHSEFHWTIQLGGRVSIISVSYLGWSGFKPRAQKRLFKLKIAMILISSSRQKAIHFFKACRYPYRHYFKCVSSGPVQDRADISYKHSDKAVSFSAYPVSELDK